MTAPAVTTEAVARAAAAPEAPEGVAPGAGPEAAGPEAAAPEAAAPEAAAPEAAAPEAAAPEAAAPEAAAPEAPDAADPGAVTSEYRYLEPGWFTRKVFNQVVVLLTRAGVSVWGSRELRVRGRVSGEVRTNAVNLLSHDGARYLVAPRGRTQWVRNLQAAGIGELRVGRRVEQFRGIEIADVDKVEVLRSYLRRWKMEVGVFFNGVGPDSTDEELAAIAPGYPVFLVEPVAG